MLRRMLPAGLLAVTILAAGLGRGPAPAADKDPAGGKSVYQRVLKSAVWIVIAEERPDGKVRVGSGSGSVISIPDRLVVTNFHVVRDSPAAKVLFPIFRKGELVAEKEHYKNLVLSKSGGIEGKVVERSPNTDLALIQVPSLPPGTTSLRLAADGVGPGDDVHSIGSPGASGALWAYTRGSVKAVYRKRFVTSGRGGEGAFEVNAKVVETSSPVNAGDSGGPVVNGAGELVAVTQGHLADEAARSISYFIDVSEVKSLLKRSKFSRVLTHQPAVVTANEPKADEPKAPAKDPAVDQAEKDEKSARAKLSLAEQFVKDRPEKAKERLEDIVRTYPKTKAAAEAKDLLTKLKRG